MIYSISNLKNANGRSIANQFVVKYDDPMTIGFQSYNTMIAVYDDNTGILKINTAYRDYGHTYAYAPVHSQTTTRNLNIWLRRYTPWECLADAERANRVEYVTMYVG